jgi:ABC-type antimicrobial peptide transport system permease subunit
MKILTEALVVGILIVIIGTIVSFFLGKMVFKVKLPPVCDDWNKNYIMEISFFLTGFLTHLAFECMGTNKWYCKYGNACLKKS